MSLPLSVAGALAWRNLWRNHRRTIIMLLAITVGVWAMIFMTAMTRGMVDQMLKDGIALLPGHVQVHNPKYADDPSIENSMAAPSASLATALQQSPVQAWSSRVKVPAVISSERESRAITLLGVDPARELQLGFDADSLVDGRWLESPADDGLVVGRKLAERLETGLGKRVVIMSQNPANEVADRGFRIVGVYRGQMEATEEQYAYLGREALQAMLGTPGQVSELAMLGEDYRHVEPLRAFVQQLAPPGTRVQTWQELNPYLGVMMKVMDGFVLVWIVVIFMALSFGLVNTLMMAVFERVREIGLMMALGLRPGMIVLLIVLESLLLLLLGLLMGNLLAIASIWPLRDGIDVSAVARGMEMMGAGSTLYPALSASDLLLANAVVMLLGLLTSLLPAWHAARYRPVEALAKH